MVLEVAILQIKPGQAARFEKDFQLAKQYIAATKGYIRHHLKKCMEKENQYLLLVEWISLEAHETGFRKSPQYEKWKALLHDYYDPFPEVFHYENIDATTQSRCR